jgi:peptide/nickel transport system substrate-binding protein
VVKLRRFKYLAPLVAASLALTACGGSTGGAGGAAEPAARPTEVAEGVSTGEFGGQQLALGDPVEGGELTWGVWMPIQALDPAGTMGDSILLAMASIYGTLTKALPDGSVAPNLAQSFETEDNTVWTMKLDPELTFTDGTPFDADAVITHLENVAAEGSTSTQAGEARRITDMQAPDPYTVVFTLDAPNNQFDLLFADGSMGMIPSPTAKEAAGADFATQPVGAGPFKVKSFAPGSEVVLAKNEEYKFADDGLPYLDQVTLRTVPEQTSRVDGVLAGDLDGGTVVSLPALDEARNSGALGLEEPDYSAYYLLLNNEHELLSDVRLRTAVSEAIDREAINQVVYEGLHQPMTGLLAPSHPYAEQDGEWPSFNLEHAQQLVEEYRKDTGTDNIELNLTVVPGGESAEVAPLLQQMLSQVGITVNVETVDQTSAVGKYASGEYDFTLITRSMPSETTTVLSQYFRTGSSRNWSAVSVPEFDEAVQEAIAAPSNDDRVALIPEMLDVLAENVVAVPIVSAGAGRVLGPDVAGFPDGDPTSRTVERFDLSRVWVQE